MVLTDLVHRTRYLVPAPSLRGSVSCPLHDGADLVGVQRFGMQPSLRVDRIERHRHPVVNLGEGASGLGGQHRAGSYTVTLG